MEEKKYFIVDSHAHIYPVKIAKKAVDSIQSFYGIDMACKVGTAENLIKNGSKIGVQKYLVHSTATTPAQVESINDFIVGECQKHSEFIGFGTMHPDFGDGNYDLMDAEMKRMKEMGLKGVKLHPDFQRFAIDDAAHLKMFELLAANALPVLFHMGDKRYNFSHPSQLATLMDNCPELIAIGAHFGGFSEWDEALDCLVGRKNLYFDTCSSLSFISPEKAVEIIRAHGADKIFFATDYPMWHHDEEYKLFMNLPLSEEEREGILGKNVLKLLKM